MRRGYPYSAAATNASDRDWAEPAQPDCGAFVLSLIRKSLHRPRKRPREYNPQSQVGVLPVSRNTKTCYRDNELA